MFIPVLLFIVGLLCLIKGGDWFVAVSYTHLGHLPGRGPAGIHLPHSGSGYCGRGALSRGPQGAVHSACLLYTSQSIIWVQTGAPPVARHKSPKAQCPPAGSI